MTNKRGNAIYTDNNLDEMKLERYPGKLLFRILRRKFFRKIGRMMGRHHAIEYPVCYNGITVFGSRDLDGEGTTVGQDYMRVLLELGLKRCEWIYEFCAGPGYIGYSLLGNGFCEKLTLSDINPVAFEAARRTAEYNGITHLVNVYYSDCLDSISDIEKWNLVVGNPPHFLPQDKSALPRDPREATALKGKEAALQARNLKAFDPDWSIHRRFYSSIRKFMKPGALVVLQENSRGSRPETFIPMITENEGRFIETCPGIDVCGRNNGMYYVVSQW